MTFLPNDPTESSEFNELMTAERTPLIELRSNVPAVSYIRNIVSAAGGASVEVSNSEYVLRTTGATSDSVKIDSADRGRYFPGFAAECGLGVRTDGTAMTGDMEQRWGYFDNDNGVYFGQDATGIFVAILKDGVETKTYQTDWNIDKLDGTGSSGQTLDLAEGNIYQIKFTWYGYGVINFQVVLPEPNTLKQQVYTVHRISPTQSTSLLEPNLPIRAAILNGTTATEHTLFLAGRQFSVLGKYIPNTRQVSEFKPGVTVTAAGFSPLVTFNKKDDRTGVLVKVNNFNLIATEPVLLQVRVGTSVSGATFRQPSNTSAAETAVEVDTSATGLTGGMTIYSQLIPGGIGGVNKNQFTQGGERVFGSIPDDLNLTLCARAIGATSSVTSHFSVTEEW